MVEEDHGGSSRSTSRRSWSTCAGRGGQSQFSAPLAAQVAGAGIRKLLLWMSENVQGDLSVAALAQRASMSERTFARVFAAETRFTPASYVERLRIDAARRSLEPSKKSVKQIARLCGFGTVETMHRAFRRERDRRVEYRGRFATQGGSVRPDLQALP